MRAGVSRSTIGRLLRAQKLSKARQLEDPKPIHRYEYDAAGGLLHLDVKKLGRFRRPGHRIHGDRRRRSYRAGWEYLHVCIDDHSRLAYVELLGDEVRETTAAFLERALRWYEDRGISPERILTDNGGGYRSKLVRDLCARELLKHIFTRPYHPQTNGKAERFIRTALTEWAYGRSYRSSAERERLLPSWLHFYNHHRPHSALAGLPPAARVNNLVSLYT
jgi:transposase InsO family protein